MQRACFFSQWVKLVSPSPPHGACTGGSELVLKAPEITPSETIAEKNALVTRGTR